MQKSRIILGLDDDDEDGMGGVQSSTSDLTSRRLR